MGQANTSPTKPKSIRKPNALRPSESPSRTGKSLADKDEAWRICCQPGGKFFIRKLYRGPSVWHQYALKTHCEKNHKPCCSQGDSMVLFTCKMEPRKPRHLKKIDKQCRLIVKTLINHRSGIRCDCDLEYIKTGKTIRDNVKGSRICETRDKAVLKAMTKHDKICTCEAFEFVEREEKKPVPSNPYTSSGTPTCPKTHTSAKAHTCSKNRAAHTPPKSQAPAKTHKSSKIAISTKVPRPSQTPKPKAPAPRKTSRTTTKHLLYYQKDPFEYESDYEENVFEGIPRKF